jgi:hypothetical protein
LKVIGDEVSKLVDVIKPGVTTICFDTYSGKILKFGHISILDNTRDSWALRI